MFERRNLTFKIKADKEDQIISLNIPEGQHFTWTKSNDMWNVGRYNYFSITAEELLKRGYDESKERGDMYKSYVDFVNKNFK